MELFKIGFLTVTIVDIIDLFLVSWLFYKVYQYFKGTRAGQMLVGLIILLKISSPMWFLHPCQKISSIQD